MYQVTNRQPKLTKGLYYSVYNISKPIIIDTQENKFSFSEEHRVQH